MTWTTTLGTAFGTVAIIVVLPASASGEHGVVCTKIVGSCYIFPCVQEHLNTTCESSYCVCGAGMCAYDGFSCVKMDPNDRVYDGVPSFFAIYRKVLLAVISLLVFCGTIGQIGYCWGANIANVMRATEAILNWIEFAFTQMILGCMCSACHECIVLCFICITTWINLTALRSVVDEGNRSDTCVAWRYNWWEDAKLWSGVVLVILSEIPFPNLKQSGFRAMIVVSLRHARHGFYTESSYEQAVVLTQIGLRLVGANLLILFGAERHLDTTLSTIMAIAIVRGSFNVYLMAQSLSFKERWNDRIQDYIDILPGDSQNLISPQNVYLDLGQPFARRVCVVFAGQMVLLFIFTSTLGDVIFGTLCQGTWQWRSCLASLLIQCLITNQMGSHFLAELFDWMLLFESVGDTSKSLEDEKVENPDAYANPFLVIRFCMSFMANCAGYSFLLLTLPLALMNSHTGFDFVKDCMAVSFIVQLDDLDGDESVRIRIRRIGVRNTYLQMTA